VRFEDFAEKKPSAAPLLGEHSRKVLSELGYRGAAFDELLSHGITRADA
jgi:crotonobetainyl-CoA:carnitine CoA-transferase CaiB-like acyl-CoA transferase